MNAAVSERATRFTSEACEGEIQWAEIGLIIGFLFPQTCVAAVALESPADSACVCSERGCSWERGQDTDIEGTGPQACVVLPDPPADPEWRSGAQTHVLVTTS